MNDPVKAALDARFGGAAAVNALAGEQPAEAEQPIEPPAPLAETEEPE